MATLILAGVSNVCFLSDEILIWKAQRVAI